MAKLKNISQKTCVQHLPFTSKVPLLIPLQLFMDTILGADAWSRFGDFLITKGSVYWKNDNNFVVIS
jgi:hypothetical protein